jgi:hypothetical protein
MKSATVPRITLRCPTEAADALGVCDETFDRYSRPLGLSWDR